MWGEDETSESELADLAALADGSLPAERRDAVEARVAASPRLQMLLADQRRALAAVRGRGEPAPPELRRRLSRLEPERRRRVPRVVPALAAAGLLAAGLLIAIPGSEPGAPSLAQAAALTRGAPAPEAPLPRAAGRGRLTTAAAGLPYPDWSGEYDWKPAGIRRDRIGDRVTTTVFYAKGSRRIGYTIVPGPALHRPGNAVRAGRRSAFYVVRVDRAAVVTWLRRGHTCVLGGDRLSLRTLLDLARSGPNDEPRA